MNPEVNVENIGEQLGTEGVGSVISNAEAYCICEERRIALVNEPRIVALQAEGRSLLEEEKNIADRLKHEPPPGDLRSRRRRTAYSCAVVVVLALAGFVFSVYALEPFGLGLKGYLYSVGIAIVVPFLVDFAIERWMLEGLIKGSAAGAFCAAILSLALLAAVRGDLMAESLKNSAPVVTFDDAQPQAAPAPNNFYDRTIPLLQLMMILLAVSMELAAGLAMHDAWRLSSDLTEDWGKLRKRVKEIHEQKGALACEIVALENAPQVFHANFWKEFYRAMLTRTVRSMITKGLMAVLAIILVVHGAALAQSRTIMVIAVDLSRSVDVRGPDGKTEFQKNLDAVTKQLAQIPADSRVTIIGITDHSFTQPLILLSATIPDDPGYFGERLAAARGHLVQMWNSQAANLKPQYGRTDILGALILSSQLFERHQEGGCKFLLVFSDMRNSTAELNLETSFPQTFSTQLRGPKDAVPDLPGVQIDILGVDGATKSAAYWYGLRQFWSEYLSRNGAVLKTYSPSREVVSLE